MAANDQKYMQIALNLARRAVGTTYPNPSVACVIVKDYKIIATGVTAPGGRPHAEKIALDKAGKNAKNACAYVTLEPCCHLDKKTAPCTDELIKAGVARVVVAVEDPFHKVAGNGIKQLREARMEVITSICETEARQVNEGFFTVQSKNRPFVTLKLATSLDGKIALANGKSQWITGEIARNYAHLLRAENDAIIVGAGTVRADDPELTCRLPGLEGQSPVRVVICGKTELSPSAKIFKTRGKAPVWLIKTESAACDNEADEIISCRENNAGLVDLSDALQKLAGLGITRVLCEGGSNIATSLLQQGLVDRMIWVKAPKIIGNDGMAAIDALKIDRLDKCIGLKPEDMRKLGADVMESFGLYPENRIKN